MTEEHDNLRAAVDHSLERAPDDVETGLRLAGALVWFWSYGLRYEGTRALTALLETGRGSTAARARALQGIGLLNVYYPTPQSRAAARESLALFEEIGDRRNAAISRLVVAWEGQYGGDVDKYCAMIRQSRDELGDSDDGWCRAMTHYLEALLSLRLGEFETSARQWRHTLDLMRSTGDRIMGSAVLAHLGIALREAGHRTEALTVLRESRPPLGGSALPCDQAVRPRWRSAVCPLSEAAEPATPASPPPSGGPGPPPAAARRALRGHGDLLTGVIGRHARRSQAPWGRA